MQNDKVELINPGSLQHLGENMLAFLLRVASSPALPNDKNSGAEGNIEYDSVIYFDILVCARYGMSLLFVVELNYILVACPCEN